MNCQHCFYIPLHSQPCDNPYCLFGTELLGVHEWNEPDGRSYIFNESGEVVDYTQHYTHYEVPEYGVCSRCHGLGQILVCAKCNETVEFEKAEQHEPQTTLSTWLLTHEVV